MIPCWSCPLTTFMLLLLVSVVLLVNSSLAVPWSCSRITIHVQLVEMVLQTRKGANNTAYSQFCFYLQEIVTDRVDIAFVLGEACHVQNPHTGAIRCSCTRKADAFDTLLRLLQQAKKQSTACGIRTRGDEAIGQAGIYTGLCRYLDR
ncbi:hypothetical protein ARMGADRAFT_1165964 [Armillaria gallica]|uniref:Uncharacterized protein n=1 Tax=Armillaria gallica TaxID=47427 RepID=A0A2H3DLD6_ARMGA|nr:hypothetical protein ARMGADRAFT_1165964 [Armillaria gallica]